MLEIKNLTKKYKAKGGIVVTALDNISLKFPETGMIFLLGKSGSGKSTLLNVVGGLDRPDSGEIIIKGRNSKSFSAADFDSYRNTYIGFIFQEYNILNEFNVEQNISLALQLQGKPNDKKTVEALLEQVDLKGYGKRKPNTLSGGQKQRVAIARALIKNPEIIMADEPTGALDSNTGKQVFDTLKKLSQEKLVIVVSHDRDFAETYGDRIIELSDGHVLSDVTKEFIQPVLINENIQIVNDHTLSIKDASKLKRSDMDAIYDILKKQKGETIVSSGDHDISAVKQAIHLTEDSGSTVFNETGDISVKEYDGKKTKFIRSHLPFSRAFKMGSSSLKTKPIRLIFTSFLTIVSLVMFGLTSTLMLFDDNYSVSKAMKESGRASEMVEKEFYYQAVRSQLNNRTGEIESTEYYPGSAKTMLSKEDVAALNNKGEGMKFAGVYSLSSNYWYKMQFRDYSFSNASRDYYSITYPQGFVEVDQSVLTNHKLSLIAGSLPVNDNEVAIPKYFYDYFKASSDAIEKESDILDTTLTVVVQDDKYNNVMLDFVVKGILNVGDIPAKFEDLLDNSDNKLSNDQFNHLAERMEDYINNSYHTFVYVNSHFYEKYYLPLMGETDIYSGTYGNSLPVFEASGLEIRPYYPFDNKEDLTTSWVYTYTYENIKDEHLNDVTFYDLNGEKKNLGNMSDNDIYISKETYDAMYQEGMRDYVIEFGYLLDGAAYNEQLFNFMGDNNNSEKYHQLYQRIMNNLYNKDYPEGYNREQDIADMKALMEQYYVPVRQKQYICEIAQSYRSLFEQMGYEQDASYNRLCDDLEEVYSSVPFNLTKINDIKQVLVANAHNITKTILIVKAGENHHENDDIVNVVDKYYMSQPIDDTDLSKAEAALKAIDPNFSSTFNENIFSTEVKLGNYYWASANGKSGIFNVLGYFAVGSGSGSSTIMSKSFLSSNGVLPDYTWLNDMKTDYVRTGAPRYIGAITRCDYSQRQISVLRQQTATYGYTFSNNTYNGLIFMLELIGILKIVFLVIGITFAVFAALMLFNFIATSIASKTKDIGILRAVGARGSDLFKIFFSESGLITLICLVLALAGSIVACYFLNNYMEIEVGIALLNFGIINVAIMIAGAILIAFIGTFIPVIRAAKRPPVESIRTL